MPSYSSNNLTRPCTVFQNIRFASALPPVMASVRLSNKFRISFVSKSLALLNTQCPRHKCLVSKPYLPRSYQAPISCRIPSTPAALMRPGECRTSPLHMFGQYPQWQDAAQPSLTSTTTALILSLNADAKAQKSGHSSSTSNLNRHIQIA